MRSQLYDTFGAFKVWQRPMNKGRGWRFEVRQSNKVLSHYGTLFQAQQDAKARDMAEWVAMSLTLKQMKAGEL